LSIQLDYISSVAPKQIAHPENVLVPKPSGTCFEETVRAGVCLRYSRDNLGNKGICRVEDSSLYQASVFKILCICGIAMAIASLAAVGSLTAAYSWSGSTHGFACMVGIPTISLCAIATAIVVEEVIKKD